MLPSASVEREGPRLPLELGDCFLDGQCKLVADDVRERSLVALECRAQKRIRRHLGGAELKKPTVVQRAVILELLPDLAGPSILRVVRVLARLRAYRHVHAEAAGLQALGGRYDDVVVQQVGLAP